MDKSPCIECEFGNEDKNSRRCMECDARVEYVSGLVGRVHSVEKAIKNEHRTSNVQHRMLNGKNEGSAAVKPQAKTGENKMTILEDKVEKIIEEICAEASVSVANLRAGRRGSEYTVARLRIAERLIANYGMTQCKIGKLSGVSYQEISYLLSKGTHALPKGYAGQDQASPTAMPRQGKTEPKTENTITIDFSGRKELLNHLKKYAGEEIRSVEDQIMYFIQNQLSFEEAEADGNQG